MLDYEFLYIISIPIYVIFIIVLKVKKIRFNKILLYSLFYFYIISLLAVTLFPIPIQGLNEIGIYNKDTNNYIPFMSIIDIINKQLDIIIKIKQIIGNIVLFIPMGFFVPLIWENKKFINKTLLIVLLCTIGIEITQLFISNLIGFSYKITDVDDILLNSLGGIIGFYLYKMFQGSFFDIFKK
ncbi:MAG: VanZ family protein [Candidatus Gracilibacteria bacterium]|nr:VanZ family protein [Candidatus Gracilibacteria bacterium]